MAEKDALRDKKIESGGGGLFVKIADGTPIKMRVLTTDPIISRDSWGGTKFAFVVWNYTENKAQILNKGSSIATEIQRLHLDEDYGANIQKMGIKITASGQGKDTKYSVDPLPNVEELTKDQVEEAAKIRLEDAVKHGIRYSEFTTSDDLPEAPEGGSEDTNPKVENQPSNEEPVIEDIGDEPISLDDIPF